MRALKRGHECYCLMTCSSEKAEIFKRGDCRHGLEVPVEDQLEALCERVRGKSVSTCKSYTGSLVLIPFRPNALLYSNSFVTP